MSLDVQIDSDSATYAVAPEYGRPVTFEVTLRSVDVSRAAGAWTRPKRADRYVVGLKGSTGQGFSSHRSFEAACRSALYRARRYDRAYSVPRSILARAA